MNAKKLSVVFGVIVASIITDQWTKVLAIDHLKGGPTNTYLGDTFRLLYVENHGAFLGLGSTLAPEIRTIIFTVIVSIFLIAFLVYVLRKAEMTIAGMIASGLVIGGGIGNLIDRVMNNGGVVDFMNLGIGSLRTGIFNVADLWIVFGVVMFLFVPDFKDEKKPKKSKTVAEAD